MSFFSVFLMRVPAVKGRILERKGKCEHRWGGCE